MGKVRKADAHSRKRRATGCTTSSNQYTVDYNVAVADDASSRRGEMDRSMDRHEYTLITQGTKKKTGNLELGGGVESSDAGDDAGDGLLGS